jgi:teichoic acid transport system permease protein
VSDSAPVGTVVEVDLPPLPVDPEYAEVGGLGMAAKYNLKQSGARPPLLEYARLLWARRHFIITYATSINRALYSGAKLGQVWQLLTPILNVAVYYFVFGFLLGTNRGVPDFILFLVIGVFLFNFLQTAMVFGSRSISDNLVLIRALHFPRASLPLAATVIQLQQLAFSMVIVLIVAVATSQPLSWKWFLILPVLCLQTVFNAGCAMLVARMGSVLTDTSQLLPFILRTWMYVSGVIYSIYSVVSSHNLAPWMKWVLQYNPPAVFISVVRNCIMTVPSKASALATAVNAAKKAVPPVTDAAQIAKNAQTTYNGYVGSLASPSHAWIAMIIWAVLVGFGGFVYFWKAEEQYGRG